MRPPFGQGALCCTLDLNHRQAMLSNMKPLIQACLAALIASLATAALAAPAPWFQWRSKLDGKLVCSQTPLGPGWEQATAPYRDSHCTKLVVGK